jgi:hypothetical protein
MTHCPTPDRSPEHGLSARKRRPFKSGVIVTRVHGPYYRE